MKEAASSAAAAAGTIKEVEEEEEMTRGGGDPADLTLSWSKSPTSLVFDPFLLVKLLSLFSSSSTTASPSHL